jgi:hypothetical protein
VIGDNEIHADKIAVIVESRPAPRLIRVIKQFMSVLPNDWEFQVWFSNLNEQFLRDTRSLQSSTILRLRWLLFYYLFVSSCAVS